MILIWFVFVMLYVLNFLMNQQHDLIDFVIARAKTRWHMCRRKINRNIKHVIRYCMIHKQTSQISFFSTSKALYFPSTLTFFFKSPSIISCSVLSCSRLCIWCIKLSFFSNSVRDSNCERSNNDESLETSSWALNLI